MHIHDTIYPTLRSTGVVAAIFLLLHPLVVPCRVAEVAARLSGLTCGMALAVGPQGGQRSPASRHAAGASRWREYGAPLTLEGPTRTMRGVRSVPVTFRLAARAGALPRWRRGRAAPPPTARPPLSWPLTVRTPRLFSAPPRTSRVSRASIVRAGRGAPGVRLEAVELSPHREGGQARAYPGHHYLCSLQRAPKSDTGERVVQTAGTRLPAACRFLSGWPDCNRQPLRPEPGTHSYRWPS